MIHINCLTLILLGFLGAFIIQEERMWNPALNKKQKFYSKAKIIRLGKEVNLSRINLRAKSGGHSALGDVTRT